MLYVLLPWIPMYFFTIMHNPPMGMLFEDLKITRILGNNFAWMDAANKLKLLCEHFIYCIKSVEGLIYCYEKP